MKIVNLNMVKYVFATTFKVKHFEIASFSFFCPNFSGIQGKSAQKKQFTDLQTANTIQLWSIFFLNM